MIVPGIVVWGLDLWDLAIILLFLLAILIVGFVVSHTIKKESDFYLGGRKLGRLLQFFLNFGNSTDATGAVQISTAVYQQGAAGIWVGGFQTLFITPFFWFTQPWWRRARLVTMGDLFVDRFNSKAVASAYAALQHIHRPAHHGQRKFLHLQSRPGDDDQARIRLHPKGPRSKFRTTRNIKPSKTKSNPAKLELHNPKDSNTSTTSPSAAT
jgi:hypothetical protein